jgi:hypothetical protein
MIRAVTLLLLTQLFAPLSTHCIDYIHRSYEEYALNKNNSFIERNFLVLIGTKNQNPSFLPVLKNLRILEGDNGHR